MIALASLALFGACASSPSGPGGGTQLAPAAWGYKPGETAPSVISESEFEQLTEQVLNYKAQRNTLRGIVRTSNDPAVRAQHLRSIDDINGKLQMLEYRLRAANRPVPRG
jgi:hypothetical protein